MRELRIRRARLAARDLLRTVGAEGEVPVPVEDVAHALGVEIVRGGLRNALACLVRAGDRARIRVADHHDHPGQLRFSIAHELGHFVLRHKSTLDLCDERHIDRFFNDKTTEARPGWPVKIYGRNVTYRELRTVAICAALKCSPRP
jgi:hypothetical protein